MVSHLLIDILNILDKKKKVEHVKTVPTGDGMEKKQIIKKGN